MKLYVLGSLTLALTASSIGYQKLCDFAPQNDRYIPANMKAGEETGLTRAEFDSILNRIEKIYGPIIVAKGGTLDIKRLWDDGTVNASAERIGTSYQINMYGVMARHELMTPDGFMLVACHEMGHQVGGKPKYPQWWPIGSESWAANEGQSDYFGTSKCMRKMYLDMTDEELNSFEHNNVFAEATCDGNFADAKDKAMCTRNSIAGVVLGSVLGELGGTGTVNLETPTAEVYSGIYNKHPKAQCRADTYFQGSLCNVAHDVDFSDKDMITGACVTANGHSVGLRPKCWFNPSKRQARKGQSFVQDKSSLKTDTSVFN